VIAFPCSHCGKGLSVKDEFAGKKGKCPHCGQAVLVPQSAGAAVRAGEKSQTTAHSQAGTSRPKEPSSVTLPPRASEEASLGSGETLAPVAPGPSKELFDFLAPPQDPDELGRLGPYRILKVLGSGGMGVVYQAEDPGLKRKVALKAMLPGLAASESARKRFVREAQTAAAIEHDHIVHIYQVGEDRGVPYMAMQFLKGEALDDRLKRMGKMPVAEVVRIGREAALGLAAAHAAGLIHRDIKPANLWLEGEPGASATGGRVKILDFGLARAAQDDAKLTQSGAIIGTPAYMAPEQANALPVDGRTDLFSLGCVLYRLCTGVLPFQGKDTLSTLMAVAMVEPHPPRAVNPAIPKKLSDLVMQLLAKEPENRPASAQQVAVLLAGIDTSEKQVEPATVPLPRPRKVAVSFDFAAAGPGREKVAPAKGPRGSRSGRPAWLLPLAIGGPAVLLVAVVLVVILSGSRGRPSSPTDKEIAKKKPSFKEPPPKPVDVPGLFNGEDLAGWEGLMAHWTYKDGALIGSTLPTGLKFNTFLCSKKEFGDFELEFQVRLQGEKANSGVQIRSKIADRNVFSVAGPQADMGTGFWGSLYGEQSGGMIKKAADATQQSVKENDFNDYYIKCAGKHVTIKVNGVVTVDDDFPTIADRGILAWQLHAGGPMTATFRSMRFKELGPASPPVPPDAQVLFNGKDLAGWTREDGSPARWKVQDGYLEVSPGTGNIKTRQDFGPDFQLHAEFWLPLMADQKGQARANSGIFLQGRYEIQILDSFENEAGIRGCGALFGQIAPKPGAIRPPEQWQTYDITYHAPRVDGQRKAIAPGKLTVIHNGLTVIEDGEFVAATLGALDQRVGAPGPIVLQNHGAPVRFRNLWIKELQPAKVAEGFVPLFNGKDLTGWEKVGGGEWTVKDAILRATGGPENGGWLATQRDYENFELELEYRLAPKGNSGVFIHAWKEGNVSGNQFLEIQLVDDQGYGTFGKLNGTAAVFGVSPSVPAVQSIPGTWHKVFIRIRGRHLEVSFDGKPVHNANLDDFRDSFQRFPGLTKATGRIGLQQYGSLVEFRNIRLRQLPAAGAAGDDRKLAEWVLKMGGKLTVEVKGQRQYVNNPGDMPPGPFVITELEVTEKKVGDDELGIISGLANLDALRLGRNPISGSGLVRIKNLPKLRELDLRFTAISDNDLAYLKEFPGLMVLYVGHTKVTGAGLAHLKALPNLEHLELDANKVTGPDLAVLADNPRLIWLELSQTPISDACLAQLARTIPGLSTLDLGLTSITDKGLEHLKALKGLAKLVVPNTQIMGPGLASLGPNIRELDLRSTKVSDAAMARLANLKALTHLNVVNTEVSDAGLKHLQGLPNLVELHAIRTRVTEAGVQKLRAVLPKCSVLHSPR
jgi:serine/threonine protein kinase